MIHCHIEHAVDEVLAAHSCGEPPVDVFAIAAAEGIELVPGRYGDDFSGRIEYHLGAGKFLLFHPEVASQAKTSRVRFSVGHELGHYFLDHHRKLLLQGAAHNSTSDFICEEHLEREADEFAAALLIPGFSLKRRLMKRPFMTLAELLQMANEWETSATSAAIRYARFTSDACVVVLSEAGKVVFCVSSDEAAAIGFKNVRKDFHIPIGSPTAMIKMKQDAVVERGVDSAEWFPRYSRQIEMWEEAFPLGNTGRVLTLLALCD